MTLDDFDFDLPDDLIATRNKSLGYTGLLTFPFDNIQSFISFLWLA